MKTFQRVLTVLRRLAPWIAFGGVALALARYGHQMLEAWLRLPLSSLIAASSLCFGYRLLNAGGWAWVLKALGAPLPFLTALRIWLISESLRWLPGSIWGFCSRVDSARQAGVPTLMAGLSLPVELGLTVISWITLAAGCLFPSGLAYRLVAPHLGSAAALSAACAIVLLVAGLTLWSLRRQPTMTRAFAQAKALLGLRPDTLLLLKTGLYYTALNGMNGVGFWILLAGLGYRSQVDLPTAIGANAAGWLAGFFAVGVPGGIGVREGCTALVLSSLMPWQEATFAAFIWRLIQVCTEFATLIPCLTLPKARLRPADRNVAVWPEVAKKA
jgi:glycosyltransferase 2 family protein